MYEWPQTMPPRRRFDGGGGWVPESHGLQICSSACARRSGIRALRNGSRETISFLALDRRERTPAGCIPAITAAVEELLELLSPRPRALRLYVDGGMGEYEEPLMEALRTRFAGVDFVLFPVDPSSPRAYRGAGFSSQERSYALLRPRKQDRGVNLLGPSVFPGRECELYPFLRRCGAEEVRSLPACTTYEEYQRMAASCLDLVLSDGGLPAARSLETRLGIPYCQLPVSYELGTIRRGYEDLARWLNCPCPDLGEWETRARAAVKRALDTVGERPVVLDSTASAAPFSLAVSLLRCGFRVEAVYLSGSCEGDREARERLAESWPEVKILLTEGCQGGAGPCPAGDVVAIGRDSAYLLKTRHRVDLWRDGGLFGFYGVARLMDLLTEAVRVPGKWRE